MVSMNQNQVIARVRGEVERAGSIRALAREWGVTHAYLCMVLSGKKPPGDKVLKLLGLRKVETVTYIAR